MLFFYNFLCHLYGRAIALAIGFILALQVYGAHPYYNESIFCLH